MNKILNNYYNILKGLARAFPIVIPLTSIIFGFIFNFNTGIYFGIYAYVCDLVSHNLKIASKKIYGNKESLPLFGLGRRPNGAKYCGLFINEDNLEGKSTSFGMPSGHAASAILTMVFWIYYLINHQKINLKTILSIILISIICLSVCLSRILLNCHTIQQVIVGGLFGLLYGFIGYQFYLNYDFS